MSKILVVGNVIKDVYLRLDERSESFETDEKNTKWLDLSFDSSSHKIFERVGIFGGAEVTLEVLKNFGMDAKISGASEEKNAKNYRYILCAGDDITYFVPSKREMSDFIPEEDVEWIFVDKSAEINEKLAKDILDFVIKEKVKLAVYAEKKAGQAKKILAEKADLVFSEEKSKSEKVCFIGEKSIEMNSAKISWKIPRDDYMTHLTIKSVVAASILGATIKGEPTDNSLLIARENVENMKLNGTLEFEKIKELIAERARGAVNLNLMAKSLVERGKGILAADESGGSIHKKFENMGIEDNEKNRRDYRNIFFTTPDLEKYVNGVILFDETARQKADDGSNFVQFLTAKGIIPGIKVDKGLVNFPNSEEKYTQGLDDLDERLSEYYEMGLRFAKWRAAFEITESTPSEMAIKKNCEILAEYAKKCQEAGIVPIVEPEVVYDGDYTIEKSTEVTGEILDELFRELEEKEVELNGTILKVNMILAGKKYAKQSTPEEVGKATAEVLRRHVLEDLAGVVFLSGGQTVEQATENLQAVTNNGPFPWPVTFSFARALQDPALEAWKGDNKNSDTAREAFRMRLVENCEAL